MSKQEQLTVKEHFIAYFDVLGYQQILSTLQNDFGIDGENQFLKIMNQVIDDTYSSAIRNNALYSLASAEPPKLGVYAFSDNVVVTIPVEEPVEANILNIVALVGYMADLQTRLACEHSIFIRGAIVKGNFYCDGRFVFGTGIIKAYYDENDLAVYPRIIIQQELLEVLQVNAQQLTVFKFAELRDLLQRLEQMVDAAQPIEQVLHLIMDLCSSLSKEAQGQPLSHPNYVHVYQVLKSVMEVVKPYLSDGSERSKELLIKLQPFIPEIRGKITAFETTRKNYIPYLLHRFVQTFYCAGEDGLLFVHHIGNHSVEDLYPMLQTVAHDLPSEVIEFMAKCESDPGKRMRFAKNLSAYKKHVEENIHRASSDKVLAKYLWAANYYNGTCCSNQLFDQQIEHPRVRYYAKQ